MDIFNFLLNGVQNANKQSSWQAKQSVSMPELILASSPSCSSCMNCTPHVHTPFAHHGHTTPPFSPLAPHTQDKKFAQPKAKSYIFCWQLSFASILVPLDLALPSAIFSVCTQLQRVSMRGVYVCGLMGHWYMREPSTKDWELIGHRQRQEQGTGRRSKTISACWVLEQFYNSFHPQQNGLNQVTGKGDWGIKTLVSFITIYPANISLLIQYGHSQQMANQDRKLKCS